ncbi:ATP phosphoribosyltransferase regulatory subunit [Psychrobacter pygoscelis]|uniref:ATP phosphoribosyltransferase regulatory subunit n=1 Tax=Psychrobacter pygoscelis TaxID=2488563 RepID=UPI001F61AA18|nr:ATP phosphoribosyltransferase regulatory subunit [Psychrobacter pygoscelis]
MSASSDSINNSALTKSVSTSAQLANVSDIANIWLLPDGVTDLLSEEAKKQEILRFQLTRRLVRCGYELICPPMIEYTESLLNNASEDLKRQTFKIIDQLTGRLMGVRADITPQILRIDAHLNQHQGRQHIARYCYAGHVIHTLPTGLFGSRTPLQLGAEIFGCADIVADIELLDVLYALLDSIDIQATLHVDIGQVGIFKRLCELAQISEAEAQQLMTLYANKALPELERFSHELSMGADFYALAAQGHDMTALNNALSDTARQDELINQAMSQIANIKQHLEQSWQCQVSIDITELSGYHYHTGLVFNVYLNNETQPVARGGRFDGMVIGKSSFTSGNAEPSAKEEKRSATGFSLDLTRLQSYIALPAQSLVVVDYDSCQNLDTAAQQQLEAKINELRGQDYKLRVIKPLSADDSLEAMSHRLIFKDGDWQLESK